LMHRIPSEHKARLIELGYIEEVFGGIRLTSAGRMRIAEGWPTWNGQDPTFDARFAGRALAEIRKQPGCSSVRSIAINHVTDALASMSKAFCVTITIWWRIDRTEPRRSDPNYFGCLPARRATVTRTTANMTMIDQLTEYDRIELLARAQDAWDRAPQNTMRAAFEWRGKNYVVSHSSVQLRIHTDEGIRVYWTKWAWVLVLKVAGVCPVPPCAIA
jgi:hypothetical protein